MVHATVLYYTSVVTGSVDFSTGECGAIRMLRILIEHLHKSGRGGSLCTTQFGRFFATCRQPREGRDEIETFVGSRHIVVMCRNQFFSVTVLEEGSELTPLPQATLTRSLQEITRLATDNAQSAWKYPVGTLTVITLLLFS
jgi:hypothetical protein